MQTLLYIIFFVSCVTLIMAVLLQPGKTDAGALFTSGVSSASMNPRGTASILSKLTIAMATIFMLSALMLSLPALTGNRSVLDTQQGVTTAPVINPNADANGNINAGSTNSVNTNAATVSNSEVNSNTETDQNTNK